MTGIFNEHVRAWLHRKKNTPGSDRTAGEGESVCRRCLMIFEKDMMIQYREDGYVCQSCADDAPDRLKAAKEYYAEDDA